MSSYIQLLVGLLKRHKLVSRWRLVVVANCVCDITGPRDWKSTNLV